MPKDLKKKPEPPQGKFSYVGYLIAFLIGALIGAAVTFFWRPAKPSSANLGQIPAATNNTSYHFINPLTEDPEYKRYNLNEVESIQPEVEEYLKDAISKKKVSSASVYFRDLTNDYWFGINEQETFSPASLMKVPVMIAVLKLADSDHTILSKKILYEREMEQVHMGMDDPDAINETALILGREYSIDRLLEIMIINSDNEATILLIDFLNGIKPGFLEQVQEDLGLKIPTDLRLTDNFISVRRYSSFFRTLYNASYLSPKMSEKALSILTKTGYGYGIRQAVPKNVVVCHKFGHREIDKDHHQLHHFAIIYHPAKPFLLGIMTKGQGIQNLKEVTATIASIIYKEIDKETKNKNRYLDRDVN